MRRSFPGTPQARWQVRAVMLCLVLLLGASISGCSDKESPQPFSAPASVSQVVATTPTLRTNVAMGRVIGRLSAQRRHSVRREVAAVIDRWWGSAYLDGPRPGADLASAFPGFTDGGRSRARADRELMTNVDLSFTSITPLMRKVHVDLLAINARARSVTARFDLRLRVTGTETTALPPVTSGAKAGAKSGVTSGVTSGVASRRLQIKGRLFLTHKPGGWKVFGYDVSKGWL